MNLAVVSLFSNAATADRYAQLLFVVLLANSLSGLPLSSLLVQKRRLPSRACINTFSILGGVLSTLVCISFVTKDYNFAFVDLGLLSITTICLNQFTILRQLLLNQSQAIFLCITCGISLVLATGSIVLFSKHGSTFVLLYSHIALLAPLLLSKRYLGVKFSETHSGNIKLRQVLLSFFNYIALNCLSTSLSFLLPIYITNRLGVESASELAVIFFAATLAYLLPRALSNKFIPIMRKSEKPREVLGRFTLYNNVCCILLIFISVPFSLAMNGELKSISLLLIIGLIAGQLTLPYSNFFMVVGRSALILRINVISFSLLASAFGFLQLIDHSEVREVQITLLLFILFQLFKVLISLKYLNEKSSRV